jgi:hypothetical protein
MANKKRPPFGSRIQHGPAEALRAWQKAAIAIAVITIPVIPAVHGKPSFFFVSANLTLLSIKVKRNIFSLPGGGREGKGREFYRGQKPPAQAETWTGVPACRGCREPQADKYPQICTPGGGPSSLPGSWIIPYCHKYI